MVLSSVYDNEDEAEETGSQLQRRTRTSQNINPDESNTEALNPDGSNTDVINTNISDPDGATHNTDAELIDELYISILFAFIDSHNQEDDEKLEEESKRAIDIAKREERSYEASILNSNKL